MSAKPTTAMAVLDTVNSRCRNSRGGSIGAAAWASTATNAARISVAVVKLPRITGESAPGPRPR